MVSTLVSIIFNLAFSIKLIKTFHERMTIDEFQIRSCKEITTLIIAFIKNTRKLWVCVRGDLNNSNETLKLKLKRLECNKF